MTDHYGGFEHRIAPENYNHFIKNFYQEKEWYEIIEKHFTIRTWRKSFWYTNTEEKRFYQVLGTKNKDIIANSENCMPVDFTVYKMSGLDFYHCEYYYRIYYLEI